MNGQFMLKLESAKLEAKHSAGLQQQPAPDQASVCLGGGRKRARGSKKIS